MEWNEVQAAVRLKLIVQPEYHPTYSMVLLYGASVV